MPTSRQPEFILAILDLWLPLLANKDITPDEFKDFIAASLTF